MKGRGILGRWGPNLAADPIVSRVLNGQLQFVAIERHDTGKLFFIFIFNSMILRRMGNTRLGSTNLYPRKL